jgi:Hemerythrin HHE cation binding domain
MNTEDEMAQMQQTGKGATPDAQSSAETDGTKSVDTKGGSNDAEQNPIAMLKSDHRKMEELFSSFEAASSRQKKTELAKQICTELIIHTLLEEELFYPACKGRMEERRLNEAQVEHDSAKMLMIELQSDSPDDQYYDAKVNILSEEIKHHIAEEERPTSPGRAGQRQYSTLSQPTKGSKTGTNRESKGGRSRFAGTALLSHPNPCRGETITGGESYGTKFHFYSGA